MLSKVFPKISYSYILAAFSQAKKIKRSKAPLQLLNHKIKQLEVHTKKIQYLNTLLESQNSLQNYFDNSTVDGLDLEDIYFFLTHKQIFRRPNRNVKLSLINNHNLDAYTKFIIAMDVNSLDDQLIQCQLVKSFNEMCRSMSYTQLAFCLTKICQFDSSSRQILDQTALTEIITSLDKSQDLEYLQICYSFKELKIKCSQVYDEQIKRIIESFSQTIFGPETELKYIYFLKYFQNKYKTIRSELTSVAKDKLILAKIGKENPEYSVKLLQYYPYLTYSLKLDDLSPKTYIEYLQYLHQKNEIDENFALISHQLPYLIITSHEIKYEQFIQIFQLRLSLGFQEPKNLGKHAKKLITSNLQLIYTFLRFLDTHEIYLNEVWIDFEQILIAKMHLNLPSTKRQVSKILKQYDILGLFKLLGTMSMNRLGSFTFWTKFNRLIFQIFMEPQLFKSIKSHDQNRFVIYCFQICRSNNLHKKVQQSMVQLALIALSNNRWSIREMYTLIQCLAFYKFGDNDLWYALENKLLLINLMKIQNTDDQQRVRRIINSFSIMKKGSFKFQLRVNKLNYLKQEQNEEDNEQKLIKKIK